jgi:uncharacterized protein YutE (UPF0331/DUF86 family)
MKIERANRYKDKLDLIYERIEDVEKWTYNYDASGTDKKTRFAVYKAFQELTEASFDIIAMACKDSGIIPKDDYENIDALLNRKIIDSGIRNALSEANGLRNRLVHRYNSLDDRIASESIQALLPNFNYFAEVISEWLKSQL